MRDALDLQTEFFRDEPPGAPGRDERMPREDSR